MKNINKSQKVTVMSGSQIYSMMGNALDKVVSKFPNSEMVLLEEKIRIFGMGQEGLQDFMNSGHVALGSIEFTDEVSHYTEIFFYHFYALAFEQDSIHLYNRDFDCYEIMENGQKAKIWITKFFGFKLLGMAIS